MRTVVRGSGEAMAKIKHNQQGSEQIRRKAGAGLGEQVAMKISRGEQVPDAMDSDARMNYTNL
jgi:hypothetical protein